MTLDPRHFSLRAKLVALVAALFAIVALCLLIFFSERMEALSRTWVERRAKDIALLVANAVAPALEFDDGETVTETLRSLRLAQDVEYGAVFRGDGTRLASWKAEEIPAVELKPTPDAPDVVPRDGTIHVAAAILARGGTKGTLRLGFSLADLEKETKSNLVVLAGVSAVVFGLGILLSFLIGTLLSRPIRRMRAVALHLAHRDLAQAEQVLGGSEEVARMAGEFERIEERRDEVVQLGASFAQMLKTLREMFTSIHQSMQFLATAVDKLSGSTSRQNQTITRQAAALQETQVTAQEIKQTSLMAAQKAKAVLSVAESAEEVSRTGESTIEQSLTGLTDIRTQVERIAEQITLLSERTRQIGGITQTVKDLADQSNMLALNAAIEAVRSGDHGKGFSVVAREIRSLADQSIQATNQVREILEDITHAISVAVSITEKGSQRIEGGLLQVKASGDNLGKLSNLMLESSSSVRQIAAAVSQQDAGINQIFGALTDLSQTMNETVQGLESTEQAVSVFREVSEMVMDIMKRYRL